MELDIIRQYQFSSTLQRMSVIVKDVSTSTFEVYCKGAPEMIISLSKPDTIPTDITETLSYYTQRGYRVIGLGTKMLSNDVDPPKLIPRAEAESQLEFLGLIVFENRLKLETTSAISTLRHADIKVVMITGKKIKIKKVCGVL